MKHVYLIQTDSWHEHFEQMSPRVLLNWGDQPIPEQDIHLPNSTWAEGRNRLLESVLFEYDYYIFSDDDIAVSNYSDFVVWLENTQPAVGAVSGGWHHRNSKQSAVALARFDACFNAYHRDSIKTILPYYTEFDSESWWWTNQINSIVAWTSYPGACVQNNNVTYKNLSHRQYPRARRFHIPGYFIAYSRLERDPNLHIHPDGHTVEMPPVKYGTYVHTRSELAKNWWLEHPYWKFKLDWWEARGGWLE